MKTINALLLSTALLFTGCASQQVTTVNSIGMTMVKIPAGEFLMGSDESVESLKKDFHFQDMKRFTDLVDEAPVHKVRITRDFYMGKTEVTIAQFRAFVRATGYVPESIADGTGGYGYNSQFAADVNRTGDAFEGRDPRYSWTNPGFVQGEDHPVLNVTFQDALAMAKWLSAKEGKTYRLPTEAEWEYACRAGQRTRYQNGNDPEALTKDANLFDQDSAKNWPKWAGEASKASDGYEFTSPAGSFRPNAFGLYDMHGNAWEWTSDYYGEDYYAKSPVDDPQGPSEGNVRVRRGGSWHTWAFYARCSFRNWNTETTRYTLVGFRLVRQAD